MDDSLYRRKSLERISSPDQLDDYLHVTSPAVWMVLLAVILLLAGLVLWGSTASFESYVHGTGNVRGGRMTISFDDPDMAENVVKEGMVVSVGEITTKVEGTGRAEDGSLIAMASTSLPDGSYKVTVSYEKTQILSILFN